jgi:hypothetical protein
MIEGRPRFCPFANGGRLLRVSFGAVIADAVVAAATSLLLDLLGTALGTGSVSDLVGSLATS